MAETNPCLHSPSRLHAPQTDAAAFYPLIDHPKSPRNYGWHWEATEDVQFVIDHLYSRGRVFDIWQTNQAKAVEWLIGEPLSFTANFDHGLHGTFCIIASVELLCRDAILHGDIADGIAHIEKALPYFYKACDELAEIRPEVLSFMDRTPLLFGSWSMTVSTAQEKLSASLGAAIGALRAELTGRDTLLRRFAPVGVKRTGGRPANWVARFIAMRAADIYVTAGFTLEPRAHGSRSFLNFLDRFSDGYPEAERADRDDLAKRIRRGRYQPQPFAPVTTQSRSGRKGGKRG